MKSKTFYLILLSLSSLMLSCNKDKDDAAKKTANKIQGKWQIDSITINQDFNGNISKVSYPGTSEDYIDFGADGNMHTYFQGKNSNSTYKVRDDTVITIGGDSQSIKKLNDKEFILLTRAELGSLGFLETTYYLRR